MNTTHNQNRWYKTRKPKVALEILACLAIEGEVSITEAESILENRHDHHVIWDSFKKLKINGMISGGDERRILGSREFLYNITEKGLELLISERPQTFWNSMLGYCYHNKQQVSKEKVKHFYELSVGRIAGTILKYPIGHLYTFEYMDFFDRACKYLLNKISNADKMPLDQIILETLAVHPRLTLEELKPFIPEEFSEYQIKNRLYNYAPVKWGGYHVDGYLNDITVTEQKWKLLLNDFIKAKITTTRGIYNFELSLFGVLFVLLLVRYNDMNTLKHGLYYQDKSLENYFDIVAGNYQRAIPRIFKKWHTLKRILKAFAIYNFDIALERAFRERTMEELVVFEHSNHDEVLITSGNKNLFQGKKSILQINLRLLNKFLEKGTQEYTNFVKNKIADSHNEDAQNSVKKKIYPVYKLILELEIGLNVVGHEGKSKKDQLHESCS